MVNLESAAECDCILFINYVHVESQYYTDEYCTNAVMRWFKFEPRYPTNRKPYICRFTGKLIELLIRIKPVSFNTILRKLLQCENLLI